MGRRAAPGMYVKNLFRLLRLLGVPQLAISQELGVPPSAVSMWATGSRPLPKRHYDYFQSLAGWALTQVQRSYRERQASTQQAHSGEGVSHDETFEEAYNRLYNGVWLASSSRNSRWAAFQRHASLRSKSRGDTDTNWAEMVALLRAWDGELRHE